MNFQGTTTLSDCMLSSNHADVVRPSPLLPASSCDHPHRTALRPLPPQTIALTRRNPLPRQSGGALYNLGGGDNLGTTTLSGCTLSGNHADEVRPSTVSRPSPQRSATSPTAPLSAPSLPVKFLR